MKIQYKHVDSKDISAKIVKAVFQYELKESIMKEHFKKLMKMTHNKKYISKNDEKEFLALVSEIENSSSEKCKKSHAKCIEKKIEKQSFRTLQQRIDDCDMPEFVNGKLYDRETGLEA